VQRNVSLGVSREKVLERRQLLRANKSPSRHFPACTRGRVLSSRERHFLLRSFHIVDNFMAKWYFARVRRAITASWYSNAELILHLDSIYMCIKAAAKWRRWKGGGGKREPHFYCVQNISTCSESKLCSGITAIT